MMKDENEFVAVDVRRRKEETITCDANQHSDSGNDGDCDSSACVSAAQLDGILCSHAATLLH